MRNFENLFAAFKRDVVAIVLNFGERADELIHVAHFALCDAHRHSLVIVRRTDAVNTRD